MWRKPLCAEKLRKQVSLLSVRTTVGLPYIKKNLWISIKSCNGAAIKQAYLEKLANF